MAETFPSPKGFSAREKELRTRVLEYLSRHPQAMDTLDGIAEWWVPLKGESIDRTELKNVLRSLTAEGLLEEVHSGSSARFSLPKATRKRTESELE
jgi:Fe2+ or Zn2+ uptake regulation protein